MIRTTLRRLASFIPTIAIVLTISFLLIEFMPGDPAAILAGPEASDEVIENLREKLGFDRPFFERFGEYAYGATRGDLGESLRTGRPVMESIRQALPVTASLALVALTIAVVIAMVGGVAAAIKRDSWIDRLVSGSSAVALAVPSFVVALALIVPFAVNRHIFPATGYAPLRDGTWEWLHHLLLPALALSLNSAAELARQVRGSVVDTLEQDFIVTARASGLRRATVIGRHALKNAAAPIITVFGLQLGRILGGAVVVERVFSLPGFGTLAYTSVLERDLPMIKGVVLMSALIVLASNLLVDLTYPIFNPKLRT